jgi:hypothetical protein
MTQQKVLFCPFCRESFEGPTRCPDHDLELVPFGQLGRDPLDPENDPHVIDETEVSVFDLRFGRGIVALGALLNALALFAELVRGVGGGEGLSVREAALTIPTLWTLVLVSFTLLFLLRRRRTPRAMRGLRVLVPLLGLISPGTLAWAFHRLHAGGVVWATGGRKIGLEPGSAVVFVALSSLLIVIGGTRLGVHAGVTRSRSLARDH